MAEVKEHVGAVRCPKCRGSSILYVSRVPLWRGLRGVKGGRLLVKRCHPLESLEYEYYSLELEKEDHAMFVCICGHRWPVPEFVKKNIEWV